MPYKDKDKQKAWLAEDDRRRLLIRRDLVAEYKLSRGCQVCGFKESSEALDLHHISDDKVDNVARMVGRKASIELIKAEMEKCVVLCANHHRMIHAGVLQLAERGGLSPSQ